MLVLVELPSHDFSQVEYIFTCGPCLILTPVNLHVYLSSSLLLLDPSPLQFYPHQFSLGGAILVLWIQPHHLSTLSKHSLLFHTRQVGPLNLSVLPHLKGQYSPTQRKGTSLITWVPSPSTHFYFTQSKWAHLTFQFYHILRSKTAPQGVQPHHLSTLSKHSLLSHTRQVGPLDLSVLPPSKEQDSPTRGPASSPEYPLQTLTSISHKTSLDLCHQTQ